MKQTPRPDWKPGEIALTRIPALIYHHVSHAPLAGMNTIALKNFAAQLAFLSQEGYCSVTYRQVLEGGRLPEKPILITFDDGYASVYELAFPLMERYGFRGVVFPIANWIGRRAGWDYFSAVRGARHLTTWQLQELHKHGWEIGSHGWNHLPLAHLSSTQLQRELAGSHRIIREIVGLAPVSLAFPFGMNNWRVVQQARAVGYRVGCLRTPSRNGQLSCWHLSRLPVYRLDSVKDLRKKLNQHKPATLMGKLIGWPARFTPFYQILFKRHLFVEK